MDPSRNRLFHDLLGRLTAADDSLVEIEREIWDRFGFEGTVLVTDLSGFTQQTRSRGIVHYLVLIRRAAELASLQVSRHGGSIVKLDGDNVIAVFPAPTPALEAAAGIHESCDGHNRTVPAESRIGICIGICSGRVLKLDGDLFGDAVNTAYKLGEDLARPGQTFVSSHTAALATEIEFSEERTQPVGGVPLLFRELLRPSV